MSLLVRRCILSFGAIWRDKDRRYGPKAPAHVGCGSRPEMLIASNSRPLHPNDRTCPAMVCSSESCQNRPHAVQQTSGRAFPTVSFVYLSVECPFNKFYGINCRPKLGAKLLDRFFHRRRQVSPPVDNLTHRFFDGSQHFLYCNFTVGSRHSAVASSSGR
jgi:hypothetical protein